VAVLTDKNNEMTTEVTELRAALKTMNEEMTQMREDVGDMKGKEASAEEMRKVLQQVNDLENKLMAKDDEIDGLTTKLEEEKVNVVLQKKELDTLLTQNQTFETKLEETEADKEEALKKAQLMTSEIEMVRADLKQKNETLIALENN